MLGATFGAVVIGFASSGSTIQITEPIRKELQVPPIYSWLRSIISRGELVHSQSVAFGSRDVRQGQAFRLETTGIFWTWEEGSRTIMLHTQGKTTSYI